MAGCCSASCPGATLPIKGAPRRDFGPTVRHMRAPRPPCARPPRVQPHSAHSRDATTAPRLTAHRIPHPGGAPPSPAAPRRSRSPARRRSRTPSCARDRCCCWLWLLSRSTRLACRRRWELRAADPPLRQCTWHGRWRCGSSSTATRTCGPPLSDTSSRRCAPVCGAGGGGPGPTPPRRQAAQLTDLVTDPERMEAELPLVSVKQLKHRERDDIEETLRFWRKPSAPLDMAGCSPRGLRPPPLHLAHAPPGCGSFGSASTSSCGTTRAGSWRTGTTRCGWSTRCDGGALPSRSSAGRPQSAGAGLDRALAPLCAVARKGAGV